MRKKKHLIIKKKKTNLVTEQWMVITYKHKHPGKGIRERRKANAANQLFVNLDFILSKWEVSERF